MKKAKVISLILAVTTLFSVSAPVYAAGDNTEDYSVMPISEVYDDYSTSLISEDDVTLISSKPAALDSISVVLNSEKIDFTDENGNQVNPQLINDRTMVPLRKIFEVLDVEIEWDGPTSTVTAKTDEKTIKLQINNNTATVITGDEIKEILLDAAPVIIEGRTLVPVRFISETLGLKVGWEQDSKTVVILDTHIILDIVKEKAPTFYAMLMEETNPIETGEIDFDMSAILNYIDSEDKANNSNIKLTLDGLVKIAEKAIGLDIDYRITGKGVVYDDMKAENLDNMSVKTVVDMDNAEVYVKSSLLDIGEKWAKESYEEAEEFIDAVKDSQKNMEDIIQSFIDAEFDDIEITTETYNEIRMLTIFACSFLSDDYVSVSGRTTKTYKYEITAEDIEKILEEKGLDLGLDEIFSNTKLIITSKYENGIGTEATLNLTTKMEIDYESIEMEIDAKAITNKINENITVDIPAEKDVVLVDEIIDETDDV